jgi:hypothetical protein
MSRIVTVTLVYHCETPIDLEEWCLLGCYAVWLL